MWQASGWQVHIHPTEAPGHATMLAQQAAAEQHRVVLAAGGDGTLGEAASGLVGSQTALGPLPTGTANSFGRELRMPLPHRLNHQNVLKAAELLLHGRIHAMDMGYTRNAQGAGHHWLLWTGVGTDGYMVDKIEPRPSWSKRMGKLGYFMQAFTAVPTIPHMTATVTVDGRSHSGEAVLVLVSNCRLYGGQLFLNPAARLDDGLLDVWLFQGNGVLDIARYVVETRFVRHFQDSRLIHLQGRQIHIETTPAMCCQTDGDKAGQSPLDCEVRPSSLRLLTPPTAPDDLFIQPGEALA